MLSTRSLLQALFAGIFVLWILPAWIANPLGASASMTTPCTGVGLSGDENWISCAGTECTTPAPTCKAKQGTDAEGNYKYCTCCGTEAGSCAPEPSCCHLVARKPQGQPAKLDVRGVCTYPDCSPNSGEICQLVSDQPVCAAPPGEG